MDTAEGGKLFAYITISRDGGFSRIDRLWTPVRVLLAAIKIFMTTLNCRRILAVGSFNIASSKVPDDGLYITELIDQQLFHFGFSAPAIIASFELMFVLFVFWQGFACLVAVLKPRTECRRWIAVTGLFAEVISELGCFSAMRLMQNIVPGKLSPDLMGHIWRLQREEDRLWKAVLSSAWFLLSRVLIVIVGMDAFLVKYRACATYAIGTAKISDFVHCFVFLNQLLGVVHLNTFTKRRIATFVFGGEDGIVDRQEQNLLLAWGAKLFQKVWQRHGLARSLCIYLTFSDMDMQKLLLSEDCNTKDQQLSPFGC